MKKMRKAMEWVVESGFFLCAAAAVLALSVIVIFLLIQGIPAFQEIGVWKFVTGMTWQPSADEYGIAPMIAASLLATAGAALLGGLIGLMCALLLADVNQDGLRNAQDLQRLYEQLTGTA